MSKVSISRYPPSFLYESTENDDSMTLQIGMVGRNGVLIAGDTRLTHRPILRGNRFWAAGTHGTNTTKMVVDYVRGIAASAARDMDFAMPMAQKILADLPDDQFSNPIPWIEKLASETAGRVEGRELDVHCLIVLQKPIPTLYQFQFGSVDGKWEPYCQKMEHLAVVGDNINAGIFWPEAYFNSSQYLRKDPSASVESLIPLAAHTIQVAHRLNPTLISGLEIVFCNEAGFHRLSRDTIGVLWTASEKWDREFGDAILNHSQELSFEDQNVK